MAKLKSAYFCQNCGYEAPKWLGKCPSCSEWNTFVEEVVEKTSSTVVAFSKNSRNAKPQAIHTIENQEHVRIKLKDDELNRVLGGGLVPGSLILFGGEPGIGKSTLLLQMAIEETDLSVLYVSGEESELQIKMRAERIGLSNLHC